MKWISVAFILICGQCSAQSVKIELQFDGQTIIRDSSYYKINDSISVNIEHLNFYISDFCTSAKAAGKSKSYHLISLDRATSLHIPFKSTKQNHNNHQPVFFRIGVDSVTNVSGVYGGDLDPTLGMYWTWNSGYINFKIDGKDQKGKEYRLHLGGYTYPYSTSMIVASELKENVLKIDVANFLRAAFRDRNTIVDLPGKNAVICSSYFGLLFP